MAGESIDYRLEKLARKLRTEGAIYGHERDLMMDAAALIRDLRGDPPLPGLPDGLRASPGPTGSRGPDGARS